MARKGRRRTIQRVAMQYGEEMFYDQEREEIEKRRRRKKLKAKRKAKRKK